MIQPLRYGIIGAGSMGREHISNLAVIEGTRVSAICDPHQPSQKLALGLAPDAKLFSDPKELLNSGLVDAVIIATPNDTHHQILKDALATELAVFIEKPLATTAADCKEIGGWASGRKALTWMGLEYRYMPPINNVIERSKAGDVGRVQHVSIKEHREPFYPKVDNWNRFTERTGGTLVEKCCHYFNLMDLVLGEHPTKVYASGGQAVNFLDESYDGRKADMLDSAFVILEYASGRRAGLDLCMFGEGSYDKEIFTVVGDEGKLESFLPSHNVRYSKRSDWGIASEWGSSDKTASKQEIIKDKRIKYLGAHFGSSFIEHQKFHHAIINNLPAEVTIQDGIYSVATGLAAHKSINEQRVVALSEILG